jgi:DNA topoisomerase 2-associated protein PAT1
LIPVAGLQGALGKTAGRSYKAAPRQLLQVDEEKLQESAEIAARKAAQMSHEALGNIGDVSPFFKTFFQTTEL